MHETKDEIAALQDLIDRSHAGGGRHLRALWSDATKIPAADLPDLLPGVQILALATVTARGAPRVGPVDGLFFRGRFWFGSAGDSARFRHLRARPEVSAAHVRGESLAIVVHGKAYSIDPKADEHEAFATYCREVYPTWDKWVGDAPYAFIEPEKMFTFRKG